MRIARAADWTRLLAQCAYMPKKDIYLERYRRLYEAKTGVSLSEADALAGFENLIALVEAITAHIDINKIIVPKHGRAARKTTATL